MFPAHMDLLAAQKYARAKVGHILTHCPDDVDDVLQEAAVKAVQKIQTFRGDSQFKTWFMRIAINEALMHIRPAGWKRIPKVNLDAPLPDGTRMDIVDAGPGPFETVRGRELFDKLCRIKLPPTLRVELNFALNGWSSTDNANTRKARRFRLRREIQKALT